jgi:hypothetical protein
MTTPNAQSADATSQQIQRKTYVTVKIITNGLLVMLQDSVNLYHAILVVHYVNPPQLFLITALVRSVIPVDTMQ